MCIGNPTVASALDALEARCVEEVRVIPMFPQFAQATTGSVHGTVERAMRSRKMKWDFKWNFFDDAGFIQASAAEFRKEFRQLSGAGDFDHLLFSFHGLPERQVLREHPQVCLKEGCCADVGPTNPRCYRAQCFATSRALAEDLGLPESKVSVAFQSRLGRAKWLGPSTVDTLQALPAKGVRKLAVMCPSFTTDCLETLEEIGMRGREIFLAAGGESFTLVPCVNSSDFWARTIAGWVRT